ncbi:DUF106 domain-containing protein [Salarchaeum sp. JOR-1]|uniref:DUF106 domain-containing protein n=1 Tax=Salarchaeum sp. JOR-1 TaxID=2599399 RepID=UPI001198BA11|nr:DUF106 domain-containing protein [Salarchaeum sp. JOR-1]QDX40785.1 DUF106 domain-containing protein [Salarchaeum sp. JOR-1]
MARTEQTVRSLVREDPELADALERLLDQQEGGEGDALKWRNVKEDVTTGQWGRLIEKGVLEDADDGFRLTDTDEIREALSEDVEADDDEDSSWSQWDKMAAVGAVAMMAGYSIGSVRNTVGRFLDLVLGPLDAMLPFYLVILVLATLTGLYSTILQDNLMDMSGMGEHQERMQEIQDAQKEARANDNDERLDQLREEQMELMGDQLGMFKQQFRPMVWIMLITIPVFLWMYWMLLAGHVDGGEGYLVLPMFGRLELLDGVAGFFPAWIVWYFFCTMSIGQILRKALNVQTGPDTA